MRIAVCDDASADAGMLAGLCRRFAPELSPEVAVFTSGRSLLDAYDRGERFDILFLDVEMPEITGLEVGRRIRELDAAAILIFATGFPQYAIEAYDCEAFHYILKPCTLEKVHRILERAAEKYRMLHRYHVIRTGGQSVRLPVTDIFYVECNRKHILYHTADRVYDTLGRLSDAMEALRDYGFYQVHQGYIVNLDKVAEFDGYDVILQNGERVMMSVRKKSEVLLAYAGYVERYS